MMNSIQETICMAILKALESQRFYDWYTTKFEDYITGDHGDGQSQECARQKIIGDIKQIFNI